MATTPAPPLPELPDDLRHAGWAHLPEESVCVHLPSGDRYRAVYARPLDVIRDRGKALAIRDDGRVLVATWSASWDEANMEAVAAMRSLDG